MSLQYDAYLKEHVDNVYNGYLWILAHATDKQLDELLPGIRWEMLMGQIKTHDWSKKSEEEYSAYDGYFYGASRTAEVKKAFDQAWLHHIHNNPHHWQYWVLMDDDPEDSYEYGDGRYKPLDIPNEYIIEMICDWWSFSWKAGDLREIFNWWDEHENKVVLTDLTRKKVEGLLDILKVGIEKDEMVKTVAELNYRNSGLDISFDGVVPIGGVVKVDEVNL